MWKARPAAAIALALACAGALWPQTRGLPEGPMYGKARAACLGCHDAHIVVQQQLDRRGWTKEVDKMIRWGARVDTADRDALIDYFASHFAPREPANPPLAKGPGVEKVGAACLGCHDTGTIAGNPMDRRGWSRTLDLMIRFGATIPPDDRAAILDYLAAHYSPPEEPPATKPTKESK
jgi:hypothetical protein